MFNAVQFRDHLDFICIMGEGEIAEHEISLIPHQNRIKIRFPTIILLANNEKKM